MYEAQRKMDGLEGDISRLENRLRKADNSRERREIRHELDSTQRSLRAAHRDLDRAERRLR